MTKLLKIQALYNDLPTADMKALQLKVNQGHKEKLNWWSIIALIFFLIMAIGILDGYNGYYVNGYINIEWCWPNVAAIAVGLIGLATSIVYIVRGHKQKEQDVDKAEMLAAAIPPPPPPPTTPQDWQMKEEGK